MKIAVLLLVTLPMLAQSTPSNKVKKAPIKPAISTPSETVSPKPGSPKTKWRVATSTSALSDELSITASLPAESEITGWPDKTIRPELIIRCKEKLLTTYIFTGMQPNIDEDLDNEFHIKIRFDKEDVREMTATKSTSSDALFPKSSLSDILDGGEVNGNFEAKIMTQNVAKRSKMAFGFTPFNSSPVETTFDLRGGWDAMEKISAYCSDARPISDKEIAESNYKFICDKVVEEGIKALDDDLIKSYIESSKLLNKNNCSKDTEIHSAAKKLGIE